MYLISADNVLVTDTSRSFPLTLSDFQTKFMIVTTKFQVKFSRTSDPAHVGTGSSLNPQNSLLGHWLASKVNMDGSSEATMP